MFSANAQVPLQHAQHAAWFTDHETKWNAVVIFVVWVPRIAQTSYEKQTTFQQYIQKPGLEHGQIDFPRRSQMQQHETLRDHESNIDRVATWSQPVTLSRSGGTTAIEKGQPTPLQQDAPTWSIRGNMEHRGLTHGTREGKYQTR